MEPLRAEWAKAFGDGGTQKSRRATPRRAAKVQAFHDKLCETRVLDPACGTGNFLYVSLEMMKRLEGEVLEALAVSATRRAWPAMKAKTIDPHQFLGLEVNPRAAAIAELVLVDWPSAMAFPHRGGVPPEPVLRAFKKIRSSKDAVLEADKRASARSVGQPVTTIGAEGKPVEVYAIAIRSRPEWPQAEFIVGNPPFIGSK